jgi:hypothetical protein
LSVCAQPGRSCCTVLTVRRQLVCLGTSRKQLLYHTNSNEAACLFAHSPGSSCSTVLTGRRQLVCLPTSRMQLLCCSNSQKTACLLAQSQEAAALLFNSLEAACLLAYRQEADNRFRLRLDRKKLCYSSMFSSG